MLKQLIIDLQALEIIIANNMDITEKGRAKMAWNVHKVVEMLEGSTPKVVWEGMTRHYECRCGRRVNKDEDMFCGSCGRRVRWDKLTLY